MSINAKKCILYTQIPHTQKYKVHTQIHNYLKSLYPTLIDDSRIFFLIRKIQQKKCEILTKRFARWQTISVVCPIKN
jgi:hypothetical protein